jgi:hypothetical protein
MIEFTERKGRLNLIYEEERGPWVRQKFKNNDEVWIARTFRFSENDVLRRAGEIRNEDALEESNDSYAFALGVLRGGYFRIAGEKLGIEHDVYLAEDLFIHSGIFVAARNISIFRHIARITDEDIYIGGDKRVPCRLLILTNCWTRFPTRPS